MLKLSSLRSKAVVLVSGAGMAAALFLATAGNAPGASAAEVRQRTLVRPEGSYLITESCSVISLDGRSINDCRVVQVQRL